MYAEIQGPDGSLKTVDCATGNTAAYTDTQTKATGTMVATVARTDTSAKNLFVLPIGAIPIYVSIYGGTASNSATSAVISIGKTGTNTFFVSSQDVKGVNGQIPCTAAANLGAAVSTTATTQVVAIYAEVGASTLGGPWTIIVDYFVP